MIRVRLDRFWAWRAYWTDSDSPAAERRTCLPVELENAHRNHCTTHTCHPKGPLASADTLHRCSSMTRLLCRCSSVSAHVSGAVAAFHLARTLCDFGLSFLRLFFAPQSTPA